MNPYEPPEERSQNQRGRILNDDAILVLFLLLLSISAVTGAGSLMFGIDWLLLSLLVVALGGLFVSVIRSRESS